MAKVTGFAILIVGAGVISMTSSQQLEMPPDLRHCYTTFNESIKLEEGETIDTHCLHKFLWKKDVVSWHEFHISQKDFDLTSSLIKSFLNHHQTVKRTKRQASRRGSVGGRQTTGYQRPRRKPPTRRQSKRPRTGFRIRKEYRTLTNRERQAFHNAVKKLKRKGVYDTFANLHSGIVVSSAHQGPNFFGWHRIYLALFEEALRRINKRVSLPFWDTTMDAAMARPEDSTIWAPAFLGTPNGVVRTGPCANWNTSAGPLIRSVPGTFRLLSKADQRRVLTRCRVREISFPNAANRFNLELIHGGTHNWVGGQMSGLNTAGHDLVFFLYHCFIDYIWQQFRRRQASDCPGVSPQNYPSATGLHRFNRVMDGFSKLQPRSRYINRDGYARYWTRLWYKYKASPTCNPRRSSCGTRNLKCNRSNWECVPRTRPRILIGPPTVSFAARPGKRVKPGREHRIVSQVEARIGPKFPALP